jgi:hypothetical protein
MTDLASQPLAPQKPLERFEQLQTDAFCEHCGYNLHGQRIDRDERLGILVCRCPECGRYHPAAPRVSAASPWITRLGTALLLVWVIIVLAVIVLAGFAFGGIAMMHLDIYTQSFECDATGRQVEYRPVPGSSNYSAVYSDTGAPAPAQPLYRARIRKWEKDSYNPSWLALAATNLLSIGSGLTAGILLVIFLWHWRKSRYAWVMLYPVVAGAFAALIILLNDYYDFVRSWSLLRIGYHALIQGLAMGLGILIGRPIARFLVHLFVPPRPRQQLAFLWYADGKTPPPVASLGPNRVG